MNYDFSKRDFHFFNIIPYSPGREKELAADVIDYVEKTNNATVLYCLSLHPEGFPAMKKALQMVESYRTLKKELAGTKVQLGVLIQSILGHWPRVDKDEEQWTRSVNVHGDKVRFCPLDENFKKYIVDVAAMLAAERPVFIMGDDDIRGFSPKAECFCQLHTAEFNRRTGKNFTPAEYREAVLNAVPGDAVHRAFEELRKEIPKGVAALIRQGIDSVDPTIPAGSCMPGHEYRFNGEVAKVLAAPGQPPAMRVCNANYMEGSAKYFPNIVSKTMALRNAHPDIPVTLDESDTFPHTLYSRSSKSMHAKLCSSIFSGLRGSKLWLVNMKKLGRPVHKNYTKILGKYCNFYQELASEVQKSSFSGIVIPASHNFSRWHSANSETFDSFLPDPLFSATTLGVLGIPFHCDFPLDKEALYALAGDKAVNRFTDDELKILLSGKLFVDGPAAAELCKRGFGEYLGVNAEMVEFRYNREKNPVTNQLYTISKNPTVPRFTLLDDSAEVITKLYYAAYNGAELEEIAPATVVYRNKLGGTVGCAVFNQNIPYAQGNEPRKEWYVELFDRINGEKIPAVCQDLQDITALSRQCEDGSLMMLVCNLNFDELDELKIRCAKEPSKVTRLTPEGLWKECGFRVENDNIFIDRSMGCYDLEIFKFS